MRFSLKTAAIATLAASLAGTYAFAGAAPAAAAKPAAKQSAKPSLEQQIQQLRYELQNQIDSLKSSLAEKDAELKQAQQKAADAEAAAAKAQAAADAQEKAGNTNAQSVEKLQSTVDDLRKDSSSLASNISDQVASQKKLESSLGPMATSKFKIGATFFADYSYWSDYDGSTAFVDNQTTPSSAADNNYNTFEVTRTYFNLFYTPSGAVTLRITPDIARNSDGNLYLRLKYGYVEFNKLFASSKAFGHDKVTFGQTVLPITDWEEGLTGHRDTYKMPMDFSSGMASAYVGAKVHGPIMSKGKEFLDYDIGIFTNGSYHATEKAAAKQFMGRVTAYPFGTKKDRTGLGLTVFGDVGHSNVAPSAAAASQYTVDRTVFMGFYQTTDKGYFLSGQYDLLHNIKGDGNRQQGYAFEGNARLGASGSPFQAFVLYQHYEPYADNVLKSNDATKYARTVGGIQYKFNKNLSIALADSNMHYDKAAGLNDANAVSVFSQYSF